jgi:hypothetical protein
MSRPDVFLSYSSKDKELAEKFVEALEGRRIAVWMDSGQIVVGDSISEKIQEGLEATEFLVLLLSPNSIQSIWVQKEWQSKLVDEAESRSALILPVLGKDCEIPRLLRDKKYADIRSNFKEGVAEVAKAIERHRARRYDKGGGNGSFTDPFSRVAPAACTALTELGLATRTWRKDELGWLASSDYLRIGSPRNVIGLPTNLAYYVESNVERRVEQLKLVLNVNNPLTRDQGLIEMEEATRCLFQKLGYEVPLELFVSLQQAKDLTVSTPFGTASVVIEPSRIQTIKVILDVKPKSQEGT